MSVPSRIRPEEVREIAMLARLQLSEEEVGRMAHDLDAILGYVETLRELDTAAVQPMTHAVPFDCPLRDDQPAPPLALDEALGNAPRRAGSFFEVPRIMPPPEAPGGRSPEPGERGQGGDDW